MTDATRLQDMSIDELKEELERREAREKGAVAASSAAWLDGVDDASLIKVLREKQKVIYGVDDRLDIFQVRNPADLADADSVVAIFQGIDITDNGDGTSTLFTEEYGSRYRLCAGEPFRDQPIGAFCSGFLVARDVIATAGHCTAVVNDVTNLRFVFGFRMRDRETAATVIPNDQIYSGAALIGMRNVEDGPDWALVRLDRRVPDHRTVSLRRTGRIADRTRVQVIGHPNGLPAKFAAGSRVRDNTPAAFFVANLDTYGGNSGSPVFNSVTHQVEGILVRGENDFKRQGDCNVSLVCPDTGCRGEDCTRVLEFAHLTGPQAEGREMRPDEVLLPGQSIASPDGSCTFGFREDGDLVLSGEDGPLWSSGTAGGTPGVCVMQRDGDLVVYRPGGAVVWRSGTRGHPGSHLVVQDDANVVIYRPDGAPVWSADPARA
ncbi:trypsin-like peptidase domain-containing protein [Actinomadura graeca]|uniref:trypsin-like peptidase domain-containing protein n=1 Tax=Actinomadura graeca TaxID=2750812 RepID=UPI001E488BD2|nr:trypsin-like peptidase domain-containing protein [Actinomadura graeca]